MSMPEEDDEIKVILKALYDVNLPKFIHDDVSLFKVKNGKMCPEMVILNSVHHLGNNTRLVP